MANQNASRRQPGLKSLSAEDGDRNGLSTSMQGGTRLGTNSHEKKELEVLEVHKSQGSTNLTTLQRAPKKVLTIATRTTYNEKDGQRRNLAPTTPTDPRNSSRMSKSFMSPTNASANRMVALDHVRSREANANIARDLSPHLRPAPGTKKGKNKPLPDPIHLKGDIRTPNGVMGRKQPQKPLTRAQNLDQNSFRNLQNARATQSNIASQNRRKIAPLSKRTKPQNQRKPQNGQKIERGEQDCLEPSIRLGGPQDQVMTFRSSSYGRSREEDFYFPDGLSPETPESTLSNSGKAVKSSWGLPSLSIFSSSPPKPDINVDAILEHNSQLADAVSRWRSENTRLNEDLRQLREVNDQHESDLRELQTKSFKEISKSIWAPLEDQVVRETLESIHKEIEDWAEENSIKTFDALNESLISDGEAEALFNFLGDISLIGSDNLWGQFRMWRSQEIDPELILTAVIISSMYDRVFRNPFLVLDAFEIQELCDTEPGHSLETPHEDVLKNSHIAQVISQHNEREFDEDDLFEDLLEAEDEGEEGEFDAGCSEPEYQEDEDMEDVDTALSEYIAQNIPPPKPSAVMLETYHTIKQCEHAQSRTKISLYLMNLSKSRAIPTLALSNDEDLFSHTEKCIEIRWAESGRSKNNNLP